MSGKLTSWAALATSIVALSYSVTLNIHQNELNQKMISILHVQEDRIQILEKKNLYSVAPITFEPRGQK